MYLKSAKIYSNFKFSNFNKSDIPVPISSLIGGRPKNDFPILNKNDGQQFIPNTTKKMTYVICESTLNK